MSVLGLVIPMLAGAVLFRAWVAPWGVRGKLALVLGAGATLAFLSLLTIASGFLFGTLHVPGAWLVGILLVVGALYVSVRRRASAAPLDPPLERWERALKIMLGIAVVGAIGGFVTQTLLYPHGNWDGLTIWNYRARTLFRSDDAWRTALQSMPAWSHPDYPPLLSAASIFGWSAENRDVPETAAWIAAFFTFGTIALLGAGLHQFVSRGAGMWGALLLCGTWYFLRQAAAQQADVPLAFFMLGSVVALALAEQSGRPHFLLLAGVLAGAAAFTKNEGQAFCALLATLILILNPNVGTHGRAKKLAFYLAGVLPFAIAICGWRALPKAQLWLTAGQDAGIVASRWMDASRYTLIFRSVRKEVADFGEFVFSPVLFLVAFGFVQGAAKPQALPRSAWIALLATVLQFGIYLAVYMSTPLDLQFHLDTSLTRLLLQLWPLTIFVFMLWVRPIAASHENTGR